MSDGFDGEVTEELKQIYEEAENDGIWLMEFAKTPGGDDFMAAAGSIKFAKSLGKEVWKKVEKYELTLGDCVNLLRTSPGIGKTREEACREAIAGFKKDSGWK